MTTPPKKWPNTMPLVEYVKLVDPTDKMPPELAPVLFGLFGEVGSVMAASKKLHREKEVYVGFHDAAVEEFGDALWYVTAIARRLQIPIDQVFGDAMAPPEAHETAIAANDLGGWPLAVAKRAIPAPELDPALLRLGKAASALLPIAADPSNARALLTSFAAEYLRALQASGMSFAEIADHNARKTRGSFLEPDLDSLPTFDAEFDEEEQIPWNFEISISQRKSGKSYLRWNGVFLGDPLTDNIADPDGYRFHDVFHLAHAAVLHWSPVFRALIKHKRKSSQKYDETQDGGRAIVVEEGLTAWIFSQAKNVGYFRNATRVSLDLLKAVQRFVAGYEVADCPPKLWEHAILQGYAAFLQLRDKNGGILIGDRKSRTLTYKPLSNG